MEKLMKKHGKSDSEKKFILKLRDYQERIFQKCLKKNLIICLPTGSGKTLITIMVMNHLLEQTIGDYPEKAKRSFFLAPKKALAIQQYKVIKSMCPAKVLLLTGDDEPDKFDKIQWMERLKKNQIFVFTPDILLDILRKGYIKIENINLIVFDEMHWAFRNGYQPSNHPYSCIMTHYEEQTSKNNIDSKNLPRILALSASLISNFNPGIFHSPQLALERIEQLYQAKIESGGFCYSQKFEQKLISYKKTQLSIDIGFDFENLDSIFRDFKNKDYLKQYQMAFKKIKSIMNEDMGIWFALECVKLCIRSLKKEKTLISQADIIILKIFCYLKKCMNRWLNKNSYNKNNDIRLLKNDYISNKIQTLLSLLQTFKSNLTTKSFTGILFVAERTDACIIYRWLNLLSEIDENFHFLKVGFKCGSQNKDFLSFDNIYSYWTFLQKVHDEDINFIVATSVLEEGIDIPICNLVIRYDGVDNYRAYCQSRGRARSKESLFYVMTREEEFNKMEKKMSYFKQMDEFLCTIKSPDYIDIFENENDSRSSNSSSGSSDSSEDESFRQLKPYKNGDSSLYPRESLQLLNKYFTKLPRDLFTEQKAPYLIFENGNKFATIFLFPINSSHNGKVIKGAYFNTKKHSSAHCAFRACKFLIDKNEIDTNLNVSRRKFYLETHAEELNIRAITGMKSSNACNSSGDDDIGGDDDDDDDDNNEDNNENDEDEENKVNEEDKGEKNNDKSGSGGRGLEDEYKTRQHFNKTSDFFKEIFDKTSKNHLKNGLYSIYSVEFIGNFDLNNLQEEQLKQLYKPLFVPQANPANNCRSSIIDNDDQTIGILIHSKNYLSLVQSYFYFNLFPIKFELKFCGTINLNENNQLKYDQVHFFHRHVTPLVFQKFQIESNSLLDSGVLIVPMRKNILPDHYTPPYSIDFDFIKSLQNWLKLYNDSNQDTNKVAYDQLKLDQIKTLKPENNFDNYNFPIYCCIHQQSLQLYFAKHVSDLKCTDYMIKPTDDDPGQTFQEYYQTKYERKIRNENIPLISTGLLSSFNINYHLRKVKCTVLKNLSPRGTLFPLEFMSVYPLSSKMYLRIASIPMVLYRLEQYLLGKEFLHSLSPYININYSMKNFDIDEILSREKYIVAEEIQFEENYEGNIQVIYINSILEESIRNKKIDAPELDALIEYHEKLPKNFDDYDDDDFSEIDDQMQEKLFQELKQLCVEVDKIKTKNIGSENWRKSFDSKYKEEIEYGSVSMFKFTGDIDKCIEEENLKFNTFHQHNSPNPWHIVQGLTLTKAQDSWNIERLECIGDSFIKFTCCLYLFFKYPEYNEMKFDSLKMALINNKNLFKIAIEKDIPKYIFCSLHNPIVENFFKSLMTRNYKIKNEYRPGLRYKDVADCIESLIGTFLVYGGAGTALDFLNKYLDLKSFDPSAVNGQMLDLLNEKLNVNLQTLGPKIFDGTDNEPENLKEMPDLFIDQRLRSKFDPKNFPIEIEKIYQEYSMYLLEEEIHYKFNDKFLLVQAFTHPSMFNLKDSETGEFVYNFIPSYQRLEFVGDAVLDYMITHFIYNKDSRLDPTFITHIKQALVNNTFYSTIVVKYGLHKFLRHSSFSLQNCIHKFVEKFTYSYIEQFEQYLMEGFEEEEVFELNNVEIPKTLADVFEAMIGAIYIDCKFDMDRTWRVVYQMIKLEIDHFVKYVPLMPLNRLSQYYHNCHFGKVEIINSENVRLKSKRRIELKVEGVGTFIGYGRNKRQCKVAAAKRFFAYEKKMKKQNENSNNNEIIQSPQSANIVV